MLILNKFKKIKFSYLSQTREFELYFNKKHKNLIIWLITKTKPAITTTVAIVDIAVDGSTVMTKPMMNENNSISNIQTTM